MAAEIELARSSNAHLLPSQAEMAAADQRTIQGGVPALELMERAGRGIFEVLCREFSAGEVLLLCGPGNNGGDGLVAARLLSEKGLKASVFAAPAERYSAEFLAQLKNFNSAGGEVLVIGGVPAALTSHNVRSANSGELKDIAGRSGLHVDALLGTGQKAAPHGGVGELLQAYLNAAAGVNSCRRVALDLPTGVNSDSGAVYEPAFRAHMTICIEQIKRGLMQYPARECAGRLCSLAIGIDMEQGVEFSLLTSETVPRLPQRKQAAHKGDFGRVFVAAGSRAMPGAAELAARAALYSGAALVSKAHFCSPGVLSIPEVMLELLEESAAGILEARHVQPSLRAGERADAVILGPGIGRAAQTVSFLDGFLRQSEMPCVIDADALNILADSIVSGDVSAYRLERAVLTPHPGEMARMLGITSAEVQSDRYAAARLLAQKTGAVVVLKGAASIVYANGFGWANTTGSPFMATGGSGDVLSGVIAGLIAQKCTLRDAACIGVFIHGLAGERASAKRRGPIIASDMLKHLGGRIPRE